MSPRTIYFNKHATPTALVVEMIFISIDITCLRHLRDISCLRHFTRLGFMMAILAGAGVPTCHLKYANYLGFSKINGIALLGFVNGSVSSLACASAPLATGFVRMP
jgi:hypothetical protein